MFGIVAEPSLNGKMKKQYSGGQIGMTNPGFMMEDIEEEGSSIGSSLPGTPQLGAAAAGEKPLPNASPKPLQNASPAAQKHHLQKETASSLEELPQNASPAAQERPLPIALPKPLQNASPAAQKHHMQNETSSSQENLVQNSSPLAQENPQQKVLQEYPLAAAQEKLQQTVSVPASAEKQQASTHHVEQKPAVMVNRLQRRPQYNIQVLDLQIETTDDDGRT